MGTGSTNEYDLNYEIITSLDIKGSIHLFIKKIHTYILVTSVTMISLFIVIYVIYVLSTLKFDLKVKHRLLTEPIIS